MSNSTNHPTNHSFGVEKRSSIDRRKEKLSLFSKYWLSGKRGEPRRKEDRERSYHVDRHSKKILIPIIFVIALSISDAVLTLYLISHGAAEINPVMKYFLNHSPLIFWGAKYFLTCGAIVIIFVNEKVLLFRTRFRAKLLLILFMIPFILVVQWELYLILFVI